MIPGFDGAERIVAETFGRGRGTVRDRSTTGPAPTGEP